MAKSDQPPTAPETRENRAEVDPPQEPRAMEPGLPDGAGLDRPKRLTGLARLFRYRLIIPIARGRHNGVPTARGTAIGLSIGLTPTVGIQMPMIFLLWALLKWFKPDWRFNLIVAFAWTWPTNIVTAPFCYYVFLITGRLMMGDSPYLGFDAFRAHIEGILAQDASFLESLWLYTVEIFRRWGVPMFIGSIPYAVLGGWGGYVLTLKFTAKLRQRQRLQTLRRRRDRSRRREAQARARASQV